MKFASWLRFLVIPLLLPLLAAAAPEPMTTVSPAEMPETEFQSLVQKTNLYVKALNSVAGAQRTYDRYASWVDMKKGPTGNERYITYGLYDISKSSVDDVMTAAKKGPGLSPPLPELEAIVARMAESFAALEPIVKKASDYYEQEDFRDDQAKGAKEFHARMLPLFQATFRAEAELRQGLDELKTQVDQRQLAILEKAKGKNYEWHLRNYLLAAKALINLVPANAEAPSIDQDTYQKRYGNLETAYNGFVAFGEEKPEEVKKVLLASFVESSVKDFFAASKFLRRALVASKRDRQEYGERIGELAKKYNELIQRTNTMR